MPSRRYTSPDEHPFFPEKLVDPVLPLLNYPRKIQPNKVNLNQKILGIYLAKILPAICEEGDDQQHGSSVNADVAALQAISKRIHYGKFVAEAKFSQNQEQY
jgi:chorismate mutase